MQYLRQLSSICVVHRKLILVSRSLIACLGLQTELLRSSRWWTDKLANITSSPFWCFFWLGEICSTQFAANFSLRLPKAITNFHRCLWIKATRYSATMWLPMDAVLICTNDCMGACIHIIILSISEQWQSTSDSVVGSTADWFVEQTTINWRVIISDRRIELCPDIDPPDTIPPRHNFPNRQGRIDLRQNRLHRRFYARQQELL